MNYGFVIDNTRCIGCHACTVACKAEHEIPIGVNRTWVKYIEKGEFPDTRRLFSVMRCNHCEDSPCTEICPTSALFTREDGIVDFNNDRCIGCKACMQACPYDALYIDPETHTAAKCNYCAHRVDVGLQPSCVNVCPTQAIISGDLDNKDSNIAKTVARNQVSVRKPEKATKPKLFYIEGDQASLHPSHTEMQSTYLWSDQVKGVGHFQGKENEMGGVISKGLDGVDKKQTPQGVNSNSSNSSSQTSRRVYDAPSKGLLWGWEVAGYIYTKAIASGIFPLALILNLTGITQFSLTLMNWLAVVSLLFLGLTGILLVKDLDQPTRFLYVLFRPHFKSWLVRGAYIISGYASLLILWVLSPILNLSSSFKDGIEILLLIFAVLTSVYTAFLFSQAKGRDFWQNPLLVFSMLTHTFIGSSGIFLLIALLNQHLLGGTLDNPITNSIDYQQFLVLLQSGVVVHLLFILVECLTPHPTKDAKTTMETIIHGRFKFEFFLGSLLLGVGVPLFLALVYYISFGSESDLGSMPIDLLMFGVAISSLVGMWYSIKIWVFAPQTIQLS